MAQLIYERAAGKKGMIGVPGGNQGKVMEACVLFIAGILGLRGWERKDII